MPEVIVLASTTTSTPLTPKAYLEDETGARVYLSWAPQQTTRDGIAAGFSTLDRPGRKPVVAKTSEGLLTQSFTALMGSVDIEDSIEPELATLQAMAAAGRRVRFSYGGLEVGWWRISGLSIASEARQEGTNAVTRATVDVSLLEDSQLVLRPGQTSTTATGGTGAGWRTYTWRKGDTLFRVAKRLLGRGNRWREIAKANKIAHPKKIKVGRVLRIPPR